MLYPLGRLYVKPIYSIWLRKVTGKENFPRNEPFIIALNHSSYYDTLLPYTIIIPLLNKQIHPLVNSLYWDNAIFKVIMNWGKCIPVYVENENNAEKKNKESFEKALNYLKKGHIIQIFPEGRRSYDGKLNKAYSGVAKLALKAKVPVVPIGIIGSNKVMPKGKVFPTFNRCEVKIGKPITFNEYYGKGNNIQALKKITTKIMKNIASLIGQEYNYD